MTKKTLRAGIDSLIGSKEEAPDKRGPGRPKTSTRIVTKSSQEGTKENETRATFILSEPLLDKIKAIAYWERLLIKDVVNTALEQAITDYEAKNGPIKPKK